MSDRSSERSATNASPTGGPVVPTSGATIQSAASAVIPAAPGASPASNAAETNSPAQSKPTGTPTDPEKDELRQLVLRLGQAGTAIVRSDPALGRVIENLVREIDQLGRREDPVYRTRVAYALQDVEKQSTSIPLAPGLRTELGALAATYPGLQNERMRDLVASTPLIDDRGLVRDIRSQARRIAGLPDQVSPGNTSPIDALENRARMSMRVTAPDQAPTAPAGGNPASVTQTPDQAQVIKPGWDQTQAGGRQQPSPETAQQFQATGFHRPGRVMLDIMTAIRRPEPATPAPWDRQLTPMGDRITAYTDRMREGDQEQGFRRAERSGQIALTAMKDFSDGPGAVLMTRIRDAAKADPNGVTGVLAEMREGGRYAGLRQDFNVALQHEEGFAAAYEKAAGAVAKFGVDRVEVEKIAAARPDTAAISGRFQKLDAEIGKAASMLPGKTEGRSFTDELAERAGEVVRKAVDAVTNAFNRLRPTSSPSPSL